MSKRLRAYAVSILTACLLLVTLPARAVEPVEDFVALPFTAYGDLLVDAAHGQVFVTGGNGSNETAVVRLDGSGVTMIPGTPGAAKMAMTQDGRHVYVALRNGDGIAEIDTTSLTMRRIDTGAGSCPTELAPVAGYVWFTAYGNDCTSSVPAIRRLDPASGTVSPDVERTGFYDPVLRTIPGTTRLLIAETDTSDTDVAVYDVADGTLRLPVASSGDLPGHLSRAIRLTNDGEHLMVGQSVSVKYYRASDLSADGVTMLPSRSYWPNPYAADDEVVAVAPDLSGRVDVLQRVGGALVNSLTFGPTDAGEVKDLELVGDQLFVLTLGSTLRLYQVDRPTVAPPELTLEVADELPIGRPVTVSGVLTDQGAPMPGAEVTVRRDGVEQPLATPTTDADGRYSFEFVPQELGTLNLSAEYAGAGAVKPVTSRAVVDVVPRTVTLTLSGPESVWPGESATLTGTLFDGDEPLEGVDLQFWRECDGGSPAEHLETVVTGVGGAFSVTDTPGYCTHYHYWVWYEGDAERTADSSGTTVLVNWVQPSITLQTPSSVHVGEAVNLEGTLSTSQGPLADTEVTARVGTPTGWRDLGTLTTDDTGRFATSDIPQVAGYHCYQVAYAGDSRNRTASTGRCMSVVKWQTGVSLTTSGPVQLDEPVVVSGRLASETEALGGVELQVSRTDTFRGTETLPPVVTAADGGFTIRDTPPNGGDVTYAVSYAGDETRYAASRALKVTVYRPERTLALTTDRTVYNYGQTGQVVVELTTDSLRTVQVYAAEAGRVKTLVFSGDVPETGLTLQHLMTRNTTFSATIAEDGRALGASASADTTTRAGLTTKALGAYGTSGRYALYRPAADPRFAATLSPARRATCVWFVLQRRYSDGWRTVGDTPTCVAVGDKSTATWTLTGKQATKTPYRVRPSYPGDDLNAAKTGSWVYFKFV